MSYINKTNGRQIRTHIDKDAILLAICIYRELLLGIRERSENCRVVTAVSWSDIFELFPLYFLENRRHQFISGPFSFPTLSCHRTFRFWFLSQGPFGFFSEWVKSLSRVQLFATMGCSLPAPPSMGFSRQEYWSGLPFASPEDLPDPGIELRCPTLQADSLLSEPLGNIFQTMIQFCLFCTFLTL